VRNNRGQFLIEAVLLMFISISLLLFGLRALKENKSMATLVSGPWQKTAGMIESGSWRPAEEAATKHPNQIDRSLSLDPR